MQGWSAPKMQRGGTMRLIKYSNRSFVPAAHFGGRLGGLDADNQLDWLFGSTLGGIAGSVLGGQFPVDLYEDKNNTYVRAELPGVNRDAISVEMIEGSLSIQASRKEKAGEGENTVSFNRLVNIPDEVDSEKVAAAYENGILTVTLPRREESKPKKINVSVN
jgi:HSP20 family protein